MKNKRNKIRLGMYFGRHKFAIFMYIVLFLIAGACGIVTSLLFANAVEKITMLEFHSAINIGFVIIGLMFVKRACWYISHFIYIKYSNKIMSKINADLATQAFKLNSKTFSDHDTGTFVQRIVTDPERVIEQFADIVDIMTDIVTALIMLIYISTLSWIIALCVVVMTIVGLTIELFRIRIKRRTKRHLRKVHDNINSLTTEIVRSEKDIKSLGLEQRLAKVSADNYSEYSKARYTHYIRDVNLYSARNLLIELMGIIMLIIAISMIDHNLITLASFMIVYSNHDRTYGFIWGIGRIANNITDIKVSSQRMFALFDDDEFVIEKFGNVALDKVKGDIEFKNVNFIFKDYEYTYNQKTNKVDKTLTGEKLVFDNLSFKIPHNKTVAFVGKSGSGKSTILNLISKMYEVTSGEVLIDGHNINTLNKKTLRKTLSLVNQFPYIFDMSIKENLLLANEDASDEDIWKALKKAYLYDFVMELKNGINTKVGESGIKLSGGQKQRLAIARALLRNSPIILFDESTSSLDNFAQSEVKKSIDGLKGTSTIIIVAHRLSTIKDADIIYFLDNGNIIAKGSFDELYTTNDKFKNMFLAEEV